MTEDLNINGGRWLLKKRRIELSREDVPQTYEVCDSIRNIYKIIIHHANTTM